ncbi:metal-dependent hydrolase [Tenacibaculum sp. IB213877]|uniref:metal-dependent hydrolase n=1 Tax=Tenacibaculum sp. IB213877 TaxID=3097351 RepID=UPI002A5A892E|nr:metal-dependent hydrolase [Tenacibaculum sp. IB213877]MDY0780007.1 metal-dependent hydrolase [Tenacibaculum sp. IB213877]
MKITFYGHACFGIQAGNTHILIDPFITGNPLASHININDIKADYILLTHAHQDHVLDVEAIAERTGATIVSNYEIVAYYGAKNLKGHPVNHGGTFKTDDFCAKYVNAIHTSSFADGTYGGQPGGFVITAEKISMYFAGDTALTMDMKLIPMHNKLAYAIFPIGDNFTMGVDDAMLASDFVECNRVIGCHYNTFPPIQIDTKAAQDKFKRSQKELILLEIGESIEI